MQECRFSIVFLAEIQHNSSVEVVLNKPWCQQIWAAQTVIECCHRDKGQRGKLSNLPVVNSKFPLFLPPQVHRGLDQKHP